MTTPYEAHSEKSKGCKCQNEESAVKSQEVICQKITEIAHLAPPRKAACSTHQISIQSIPMVQNGLCITADWLLSDSYTEPRSRAISVIFDRKKIPFCDFTEYFSF